MLSAAKKEESESFYELKGVVDEMIESLGIAEHWYDDAFNQQPTTNNLQLFHSYRRAEIKVGDDKIGNIGEIHPVILGNIKAKARIVAVEIDFETLAKLAEEEIEYRQPSKFPSVMRDIAVLTPAGVKTEAILNVIENSGGELLADTDLFDYFQDEAMKKREQKSLAFHLKFESRERTLTDEEIDKIVEKIIKNLEIKGWNVRR